MKSYNKSSQQDWRTAKGNEETGRRKYLKIGAPETIRTSGPSLRRRMLYPTELRGRGARILSVERFKLNEFNFNCSEKNPGYPVLGTPWVGTLNVRSITRY